jgi:succinate dehydrogenase/fumarate reductase flavoprotein subunit
MVEAGIDDSIEQARLYLQHTVRGSCNESLRSAFLTNGNDALIYLESNTSVRLKPVKTYPDYYPDQPGATTGGRVLEPVPFDARALGEHFRLLRWPLPEFTLLRGMMIDRADIPHFRKLGRSWRSTARVIRLLARYGRERLSTNRGATLYLGNALAARLLHSLVTLKVEMRLSTIVAGLVRDDADAIAGVTIAHGANQTMVRAKRGVVLATGGFPHAPKMRARHLPSTAGELSVACPSDTGDGIELAEAVGAASWFRNGDNAYWTPVSRFRRRNGEEALFPHTVTDRAKPGVIAVNRSGRRFTNEAVSYHEFVRAMFRAHNECPSIPCHLICDRRFIWKYGLGSIKPLTLSLRRHVSSGYLTAASTVGALAGELGLDADNLELTVARFNTAARAGVDDEFGRGSNAYQRFLGDPDHKPNPCVAPIEQPPFYAITIYPGDLGTAGGLVTDEHARVLDQAKRPIRRLYACGNDMSSIMNGDYPRPGITLGPALTFGYLAARHMASEPA